MYSDRNGLSLSHGSVLHNCWQIYHLNVNIAHLQYRIYYLNVTSLLPFCTACFCIHEHNTLTWTPHCVLYDTDLIDLSLSFSDGSGPHLSGRLPLWWLLQDSWAVVSAVRCSLALQCWTGLTQRQPYPSFPFVGFELCIFYYCFPARLNGRRSLSKWPRMRASVRTVEESFLLCFCSELLDAKKRLRLFFYPLFCSQIKFS